MEVEIKEITRHATGDRVTGKGKGRKRGGGKQKSLGAQYGAGTLTQALNGGARGAGTNLTEEGNLGLQEEDWGSHGGRLGEIVHFNKFEKLFAHLQGMVDYPGRLGDRGLGDHINSRIVFDENSHCDWSRSHVGGANPYFRVYALALLRKLCAMKTVEHIGFQKNQFVDIAFNFEVLSLPEQNPRGDFIQGNVLSFRRTYIKPKYEIHAGPLQWSPIAPNMIFLDFPWIFEHWEKWVEGKDPLAEFKER